MIRRAALVIAVVLAWVGPAHAAPGTPALSTPVVEACSDYGVNLQWSSSAVAVRYDVLIESGISEVRSLAFSVSATEPQPTAYTGFLDADGPVYLVEGQPYRVLVRAVDNAGAAAESVEQSFVMPVASPVSAASAAYEGSTVKVGWTPPSGACGIVVTRTDTGQAGTLAGSATSVTDGSPVHGETSYDIATTNARGPGLATSVTAVEALPAIPTSPTCAGRNSSMQASTLDTASIATVCLINFERVSRGLQPVWVDDRLAAAARGHAQDMVARGFFDHDNPDGCDPSCRAEAAGYPQGAGENIGNGYDSPSDVATGWMNSSGHRSNILGTGYATMGSGTAVGGQNGTQWVHTFGGVRAPFSAVSGLEQRFQGAPTPGSGNANNGEGTVGLGTQPRQPVGLRLVRARLRSDGLLNATAGVRRAVRGRVQFRIKAASRSRSYAATIAHGRARLRVSLPARLATARPLALIILYPGSAQFRPDRIEATFNELRSPAPSAATGADQPGVGAVRWRVDRCPEA